jgi:nucleotide-binding universal stress UspA family protein
VSVAGGEEDRRSQSAERRIVVGVDGSDSSVRALEWAARQAELTHDVLDVVTTWEWPANVGWSPAFPEDWDPQADITKILDEILVRFRQAHPDVAVQSRVVEGHPAPVLIEASLGAELLVVGSRGHGAFTGMLLGSVGEHCTTHAYCPVVILRDRG